MAQSGYTPIQLYYSSTASATPLAANLAAGELAINTLDEKLYFKNSTGTVKLLASSAGASGSVTSVAQTFTGGLISVSGSPITTSGTLALTVAGTSGGIPYFSSASTWASSAALAANAIVIGGGAGVAPSTTTTGTGVLTALGTNVGTAGAFVVNGGALGTPSSGTLTNATGLPLSTGVTGTLPVANGGTGLTTAPTNGQIDIGSTGVGFVRTTLTAGTGVSITNGAGSITINATGSGGTVTSVGLSAPSFLSVSGSPVTGSGTLALSYSGTALPIANGGTGVTTTPTNGQVLIGNGTNYTLATLTAGTGISVTNGSGSITIASSGGSAVGSTLFLYQNFGGF